MANTPDVSLSVDITADEAIATAKRLQENVIEIFKAAEGKQGSAQFQQLLANLDKNNTKSIELTQNLEHLNSDAGKVPTSAYSKLVNELDQLSVSAKEAEEKVNQLSSVQRELVESGRSEPTPFYTSYLNNIDELREKIKFAERDVESFHKSFASGDLSVTADYIDAMNVLDQLTDELRFFEEAAQRARDSGKAFTTAIDSERYADVSKQLAQAIEILNQYQDKIAAIKAEMDDLKSSGGAFDEDASAENIRKAKDELSELNNQLSNYVRKGREATSIDLDSIFSRNFGNSIVDFANNLSQLPRMVENTFDQIARMLPPLMQVIYSIVKAGAKLIVNAFQESFKLLGNILKNKRRISHI